jgi:actin-related protein 4
VSVGETAKWVPRPLTEKYTHSYFNFQAERVYHEFKESMVQVYETPLSEAPADETWPTRLFEFPDGYNSEFGIDRFNIGESLFKPDGSEAQEKSDNDDEMDVDGSPAEDGDEKKADTNLSSLVPPFSAKGISDLIIEAINSCDVDIRANLANNIVITGGTSLVQGFTQRVSNDLSQALSGFKIRIHAPGNTAERNYSSWIGGSILSSLGTFHQLWVSKKEYEEVGAEKLLERRFR